jgi:prepilin-type processing-associated H-X9-DG protein
MTFASSGRSGKTMADLVVGIFLVLVIVVFLIGAGRKLTDREVLVICAGHLRQIGQGLMLYANDNKGAFPRTRADLDHPDKLNFFTGKTVKNHAEIFSDKGPELNDVTAAMFLICRTEELSPKSFICPGTDGEAVADEKVQELANFPSAKNLGYSMFNMYVSKESVGKGVKWNNTLDPSMVIAADLNPGVKELLTLTPTATEEQRRTINSTNHRNEGQNVLYADGHCEFQKTPFCNMGDAADNIYTFGDSGYSEDRKMHPTGGTGIKGSSVGPLDTVLLPAAEDASPKPRDENPDESEFPAPNGAPRQENPRDGL